MPVVPTRRCWSYCDRGRVARGLPLGGDPGRPSAAGASALGDRADRPGARLLGIGSRTAATTASGSRIIPWRRGPGRGHGRSTSSYLAIVSAYSRLGRMRTRRLNGAYKMDAIKKKFPNHTEIAYRQAVSKLKYLLAESYAPKLTTAKPTIASMRALKERRGATHRHQAEESGDEGDEAQSVTSDFSKREPWASIRSKYYPSRLGHFQRAHHVHSLGNGEGMACVSPADLTLLIERQQEYIGQLESESQYCREELRSLVEKVKEVVAENEALQDKNKAGFFKTALEGYAPSFDDSSPQPDYRQGVESRPPRKSRSPRPLEGPSIVFESRISELEAQLTQARLELRKAREEAQESLNRLSEHGIGDEPRQRLLHAELERASREKRELEARADEMQRELDRMRSRDADVEAKSKRVMEVAQQAEQEKARAEAEVRRLKDELERGQEKLKEALQESNRRTAEEKEQMERRFGQQVEQLTADVASHWEAASKSHLEAERQRREIAELKRELAQRAALVEDLKKELQLKISKLQEELNQAIAEKDASQEEVSNLKLTSERNERQARQEQSRLQAEINSYKMRLERADADLVHARRENLRLTEQIGALEKEISMNRLMEETRVGPQPSKFEKVKDEKDKDKELASLIYDLENKQAKMVTSLEDSLNKQASLLTAECQSLTRRLEANDKKHKKEMAHLQSNLDRLSNKIGNNIDAREGPTGESSEIVLIGTKKVLAFEGTSSMFQKNDNSNGLDEMYNERMSQLESCGFENPLQSQSNDKNHEGNDPYNLSSRSVEERDKHEMDVDQKNIYNDDSSSQHNKQYNQNDPTQYQEYYNPQSHSENQECAVQHQF